MVPTHCTPPVTPPPLIILAGRRLQHADRHALPPRYTIRIYCTITATTRRHHYPSLRAATTRATAPLLSTLHARHFPTIGFTSSAVFGTFLGLYVDKYGRKAGCIVFCVLEIIINSLEHFPNLWLLLLGRILGGISTSLLFSAFESWMVTEHRKRKFPDEWLASTYSYSSIGNGLVAILAGVLAQVAADAYGDIGPFRLAIALTFVTLVFVCFGKENYGERETGDAGGAFGMAWREICTKREIALLGGVNAFFEGYDPPPPLERSTHARRRRPSNADTRPSPPPPALCPDHPRFCVRSRSVPY